MLKGLGHVVAEAASGDEALLMLQTYPVDVLITDLDLPGMSGPQLAERARSLRAGVGIVFATGSEQSAHKDRRGDEALLLRKPYDSAGLAQILRSRTTGPREKDQGADAAGENG